MRFDIEHLEVALYDLHSRLDALKRAWVQYISGEHKTAAQFRELVAGFKAKARDLRQPASRSSCSTRSRWWRPAARSVPARRGRSW